VGWAERVAPRDTRVSLRVAMGFFAAATVVTVAAPPPGDRATVALVFAVPAVLAVLCGVAARIPERLPAWTCLGLAFLGVMIAWLLDLLTDDATFGGQVVLLYPVLFAASQLPRGAAWAVAAGAVAADTALVLQVPAGPQGHAAVGYFLVTVVTVTGLLTHGAVRQEALVRALSRQASQDHLTGLANRRNLDEAAERALAGRGAGTALVLIDLDHFKAINDRYGHPAGDAVLQLVADAVSRFCRKGDVASRIGGDELALLLPDCTLETAARRAEEIVDTVRRSVLQLPDGARVTPSASVGYVHSSLLAEVELTALYAAADEALYRAKRGGRDQVAAATPR
jgi:diguanylate cyclase (GGDEF)-like protein